MCAFVYINILKCGVILCFIMCVGAVTSEFNDLYSRVVFAGKVELRGTEVVEGFDSAHGDAGPLALVAYADAHGEGGLLVDVDYDGLWGRIFLAF